MSNFWEAAPIAGQQPQQPQTPPPQPAANFWEDAPVAGQPAAAPAPAPTPAPVPSIVPAVNPAAIRQDTSGAALVAPGSVPGNDGYGDEAAALGYGTARSVAPAFAGGAAAAGIGGLLTATGVGAPVGIPLTILGAFGAGYGTRVAQDKLIEPSDYEKQVAAQHPTLYNTIPAVATMPLGGGRFGVQNIKDLGTAVSAARAGRVLTEAEKAAAIAAGTQVGVNVAIPAATRTYNVSQGQEFGLGDFLIEAGAAPFVGGRSYRPVEIVQNVAQTAGFKAGDAMRRGARTAGQTVGATARPTAAGEVNQPPTQFNGVDLVMPEGFNPIIWGRLTDEGRFNAIKDFEARAAAEAAQAQAAAPQPAPMAPPRPEQGTLPVPPAAEAPAPALVPETPATPQAEAPAPAPAPEIVPARVETPESIAAEIRRKDAEVQSNLDKIAEENRLAREAELRANESEPKLPRDLAGGRARFGFGDKNVELNFASDLDKAAFIVSQATKNKRHDDYIKWAMDRFGMTEAEVLAHGQRVRSSIKEVVRNTDGPLAQISRVERPAPAPKPAPAPEAQAPAPKPQQTEIPGAQDAFNLAPEQTQAPAPQKPADATPELVQPTEPSYVGPARKRLADLEAQGKGESPEAAGLREVIRSAAPKPATPEPAPAQPETPAPKPAAAEAPAPKPVDSAPTAKPAGVDYAEAVVASGKRATEERAGRVLETADRVPASVDDSVSSVEGLSGKFLSKGAKEELRHLAEDGLNPDFVEDAGVTNLKGHLEDLNERLDTAIDAANTARRDGNDPKVVARAKRNLSEAKKAVEEALAKLDEKPPVQAKPVAPEKPAPATEKPAPAEAPPAEPAPAEPVDVQRARKYIEQQSKNQRPASRKKLQEAKDVVEQYELDELARAPGNKLGDLEMEGVSDETLTDIADGYNSREDAGDTLSPEEALHKQQVEKELMRRFESEARDTSGELSDDQLLLEQGRAAIRAGRYLPRLPRQYGADQIAGYLGNASKRLQRLLFRNPKGVKIKKNPTREEIEAARRAADAMVSEWHESAGQNNETYNSSRVNSDEAVNAFLSAADSDGAIQESGSVPRRYKTLAEDMDAEGQPPVRETDEAMPDVDVDPETGATIRTEEVDPAEAALAGRDETPLNQMPPHLDDGQGGRTLTPETLPERLDKLADDTLGPEGEGRLHSPTPSVLSAMVWKTARAMQKGAVDAAKGFKSWSKQFVRTYGSAFKAYAQYVWDAAKNTSQKLFVNFKPRALAGISEKANQVADRNQQSPAAKEVAAIIFNRPGARTAGQGMGAPMRIESAQARVRNKLAELAMQYRDKIGQMTDAERAMFNKLCRRIHEGNAPMPKGWVGDFVRGMRDILRNDPDAGLLAQQNAGVDIGDVGETYFPRNLDSNMVKAREGEFIKAATEAYKRLWNRLTEPKRLELFPELGTDPATRQPVNDAFFEAKAREYYNRVTEQITDGDLLPMFEGAEGTKARVTKERVFNNDEASLFDEFYTNDYLGDIERYLASAARRKVSAEAIGPNGEKLADLSQRMAAEGVSPDDRREMRDLLKVALGIGRKSDDQMTAAYFDATGFVQGAVMLGRSFWNNLIQEPMQIGVRASTKPLGVDAPINILRAYKDTYTNFARDYMRLNPEQARRFRQATGKDPAFSKNLDEILSEELGLNGLNDPSFYAETSGDFGRDARGLPGLRRLTGKIFDLNLLSPTEAAKVTASVSAARRFLADNLRFAAGESKLQKLFQGVGIDIGGRKTAKLYLSELGIKESEIQPMLAVIDAIDAAQKSGGTDAVIQLISGNDPWAVRYREALGTFSRQSSVKPSRATKPTFQDEGLGRMFLQLKGFSYDFEQSINLRRWGLMKEAVTGKNWGLYDRAVMAGPLLGMPLTVAATAGKFALMNMLYPSEGSERRKREPVAMKGLDAASYEGVFGPFFEALFKTQRQQTPMGGAVGQVVMDVSKAGVNAVATESNTNAPERQVARTGYRNVVKPAIAAASTILPRPLGTAVNLGLGATQPEEAFVDETAGEKGERDKKRRGW